MFTQVCKKLTSRDRLSWVIKVRGWILILIACLPGLAVAEPGVTDNTIRIGSTLPLQGGDVSAIGQSMKDGIEAALKNKKIQGRTIEFVAINDFYNPSTTVDVAKKLIEQGIFLMLGSFGSPTTKAVLPVLAEHGVPAVGFYTGAGFTGPGDVLNFRAPYAQEVAQAIQAVLAAGVKPTEICAYVQNDAFGMAGLSGMKAVLQAQPGMAEVVAKLDQLLAQEDTNPERNNVGPVGVYQRDTLGARNGYLSLKNWEETAGVRCRFVATVAVAPPAAQFIAYAAYKKENWVFGVPSPAAVRTLITEITKQKATADVLATEVVPALDSALPIVESARAALGEGLNPASLEGYIVGQMFLTIMNNLQGEPTRANFLQAARSQPYDLGGITVDFTTDNQGSDFVQLTHLQDGGYKPITPADLTGVFQ